jgi:hypothetical protein
MSIEARLAVVEAEVRLIRSDVSEVKGDVKSLLISRGGSEARSALGKYVIPGTALVLSILAFAQGT